MNWGTGSIGRRIAFLIPAAALLFLGVVLVTLRATNRAGSGDALARFGFLNHPATGPALIAVGAILTLLLSRNPRMSVTIVRPSPTRWSWKVATLALLTIMVVTLAFWPSMRQAIAVRLRPVRPQARVPEPKDLPSGSADRVLLPESIIKFLVRLYKTNTTDQADQLAADYVGKWLKVSTTVSEVEEKAGDRPVSFLGTDEEGPNVQMVFAPGSRKRASSLKPGSKVVAIGRIESIDSTNLYLEDCELITESDPPRPHQRQ